MVASGSVALNVPSGSQYWSRSFKFTGSTCPFNRINRFSGDTPEPSKWEKDKNMNGILDVEEDWDGDGIPNGEDANPYNNDQKVEDLDGNNIPDNLDPYYESLTKQQEVVRCYSESPGCNSFYSALRELTSNNQGLKTILRDLSAKSVTKQQLQQALSPLAEAVNTSQTATTEKIQSLGNNLGYLESRISDSTNFLNRQIESLGRYAHNNQINNQAIERIERVTTVTGENVLTLFSRTDDIKTNLAEVYRRSAEILNGLNAGEFGSLTPLQQRQLKNAAKSWNNPQRHKQLLAEFAALKSTLSDGSLKVDITGLETSLQSLSDKLDGLDGSDMTGVEEKLNQIIKGLNHDSDFVNPDSGFEGDGFLISDNQMTSIQEDIVKIKEEIGLEADKFKSLFSIDTSSFNNGTFKEHTLNLNVNGAERSFQSGVFAALLDNASLISAVIMFLFVLSGIKMLGKE